MLRHLRVTNFAILSDVELELGDGLNVLTGETGAGKSLIVEAVNLLRGGRASADIPRAGTEEAVVEAIVEIPDDLRPRVGAILEGAGLPLTHDGDPEVFIRRVIQRGGRSRTYVNGALTTAARLAELGALLIDLSGQHQHQGLVDPSRHLEILDAFAGKPALVATMSAAWAELRRCDDLLASMGGDERAREARVDYLRYQLEELDGAALQPGEDRTIEIERARLASVDHLQGAARAAEHALYSGDDNARDRVAVAAREVERARRVDRSEALEAVSKQLADAEAAIDDAADALRAYADKLEGDPEKLALLDERLALFRRLLRKHSAGALDEVIEKAVALRTELDGLSGHESRLAELTSARAKAEVAAITAAAALTKVRQAAAKVLEKQVAAALGELGMGSAKLTVAVEQRGEAIPLDAASSSPSVDAASRSTPIGAGSSSTVVEAGSSSPPVGAGSSSTVVEAGSRSTPVDAASRSIGRAAKSATSGAGTASSKLDTTRSGRGLGPTGLDRVELVLASNKGEEPRALAKIASGGELSRIMLALKLALTFSEAGRADPVATYVFDEVDSGIGGAAAQVVGAQIKTIASGGGIATGRATKRSAETRQVLCVTHLPQIAAFADHHFHVEKSEIGGRIETHVKKLAATARKDELARMLGGSVTAKAKAHAAELLAAAAAHGADEAKAKKRPRA